MFFEISKYINFRWGLYEILNGLYNAVHYPSSVDPFASCTKTMRIFEKTPEEN